MSWTPQTKNLSTFTPQSQNTSTWDSGAYYLLQEIGDYLLQEDGCKILLQESYNYKKPITYSALTKNTSLFSPQSKNIASWTSHTKH